MFGPGMTDEQYKKLPRAWKITYWIVIAIVFSIIGYFWIRRYF
ncbi:hypothetical protein LT85_2910 [Collimonas arenae]|uniref:Uncharacterized protein n=1 Tax=Collimonas arenae TaxID=279058 RepID=A0A0A1FBE0_9BURK|nr:hypothetical protein LT85_2910 [Collimonas arenae]